MSHPANAWQEDPAKVARVRQMQEDLTWAEEHYAELDEQYRGEYVGLWRKQVIGHSTDLKELLDQVVRDGFPRNAIAVFGVPAFFETPH
jgi:Family of unknown function (DUF5678)